MEVQVQGVFWRAQHLPLLISTASGGHLLSRRGRALLGECFALPWYRELLSFTASLISFFLSLPQSSVQCYTLLVAACVISDFMAPKS